MSGLAVVAELLLQSREFLQALVQNVVQHHSELFGYLGVTGSGACYDVVVELAGFLIRPAG